MGLFGKKIPDGIRVVFYEGDLEGFQCNFASQLLLMDDVLRITKINPYVEARLDRNRISSIDIFSEVEYMAKYKGASVQTSKEKKFRKRTMSLIMLIKMEKRSIWIFGERHRNH